jgi:hypothetical protein
LDHFAFLSVDITSADLRLQIDRPAHRDQIPFNRLKALRELDYRSFIGPTQQRLGIVL